MHQVHRNSKGGGCGVLKIQAVQRTKKATLRAMESRLAQLRLLGGVFTLRLIRYTRVTAL
jgi:hypothetical protein